VAKVKVIELTKIDLYIFTERYLKNKRDKQIFNKRTNKFYANSYVINRRTEVMQYNGLKNDYELAHY
jgi:hypothetical protein